MAEQETKKQETKKPEKKKKRKAVIILLIFLILALALIGVLVWLLLKKCSPTPSPTPTGDEYTVTVHQPPEGSAPGWVVRANGNTEPFKAKAGTTIEVTAMKENSNYCYPEGYDNAIEQRFQIEVAYQLEGKTEYLNYSFDYNAEAYRYEGTFAMINTDIDINIRSRNEKEDYLYYIKKDTATGKDVTWVLDDETVYIRTDKIVAYDFDSFSATEPRTEETLRDDFNEKVYVGKNIKNIQDNFLCSCKGFNSEIVFNSQTNLKIIGEGFLTFDEKFNQTLNIPKSVWLIAGDFLHYCLAFDNGATKGENIPLDLSYVQYLDYIKSEIAFMCQCKSFNQIIYLDSLKRTTPNFMNSCEKFNQNITIPASVETIRNGFMYNCKSMICTITLNCPLTAVYYTNDVWTCSTNDINADCYTKGFKVAGPAAQKFYESFVSGVLEDPTQPQNTLYRKIIQPV